MKRQQIIVHAGFHKTGTSAVQSFLGKNGKHLWPYMALVLPARIADITRCATLYSVLRDPVSLDEFHHRLTAFLRTLDIGRKRHLLISAEDLAGLIPGRNRQLSYGSSPALMAAIKSAVTQVFDTQCDLTFYFCTRETDAWLRSSYWQNLRASNLQLGFDAYCDAYDNAADFDTALTEIRHAVGDTHVMAFPLEGTQDLRFGPASPLFDLITLPKETRAALVPVAYHNTQPPQDLVDQIRDLNRSGLNTNTLAQRKKTLLDLHSATNSG